MLIKLKTGKIVALAKLGQADNIDATDSVKVWDMENMDMFGKPELLNLKIGDIDGFLGSISFSPPDNFNPFVKQERTIKQDDGQQTIF